MTTQKEHGYNSEALAISMFVFDVFGIIPSPPLLTIRVRTMDDPIGFFLTWATYGTWLPGDSRGWIEYRKGWQLPDPARQLEAMLYMSEDACWLTPAQRSAVENQVAETCCFRGWHLHAVNCRSNHLHVVVTALNTAPKKIRVDLKAWATRCLKENFDKDRDHWWAERGSIRYINDDDSLEAAIIYVRDAQDFRMDDSGLH